MLMREANKLWFKMVALGSRHQHWPQGIHNGFKMFAVGLRHSDGFSIFTSKGNILNG